MDVVCASVVLYLTGFVASLAKPSSAPAVVVVPLRVTLDRPPRLSDVRVCVRSRALDPSRTTLDRRLRQVAKFVENLRQRGAR